MDPVRLAERSIDEKERMTTEEQMELALARSRRDAGFDSENSRDGIIAIGMTFFTADPHGR